MKLNEAYDILGLAQNATPEEAKKQYRKLTKEYHPDINKDPGAEDKFKKINEAYQCVSTGKGTDREPPQWQHQTNNNFDPFNPFNSKQHVYTMEHIESKITISFKESVIGCKKVIKYQRKTKCTACNGQGHIAINNGCAKCGGRGQIMQQRGGMIFIQTCDVCGGRHQVNPCITCNQAGVLDAEASITVTIPGGVQTSNILRLSGMGHYVGNFGPMEQHTDVHLHIAVTPEPGLMLDGAHVISNLSISLLEALSGCKKKVNTIMGLKEIEIKPKSRNKDEVILPKFGVNRAGDQKVILDVQYPEDISSLISNLTNTTERIN